ncbi:hypothetical protein HK098_007440 [Nowakowskiella sp. JEL0407]|nr:hypothetical protein HK098_007440 [Nowakowskiella sp. JEL0407]
MLHPNPPANHPIHQILNSTNPLSETSEPKPVSPFTTKPIAFTLDNILTASECEVFISETEKLGYDQALLNIGGGRQILATDIRKSSRCIIDSPELASKVWSRIRHHIPETFNFHRVVGLNERFRVLKYLPGDVFHTHMDGTFVRDDKSEFSQLTLQLYLNGGCVGGETTMWIGMTPGVRGKNEVECKVTCEPGKALVFEHEIFHEGSPVIEGVKYVIRTDIMYERN